MSPFIEALRRVPDLLAAHLVLAASALARSVSWSRTTAKALMRAM